ncbi:MAG: phosphodiester glycosidase family protein [Hyphomonadaceae bacterium]|nr:phosphodiester glycosidase family protein [Hyphomonadaceae bacterium]
MEMTRRAMAVGAATAVATPAFAQDAWRELAPGLALMETQTNARIGDRKLHALRIDPARYEFTLLTGRLTGQAPQTARAWAGAHGLVAATNAAMFGPDGRPVAYAKANGEVVTPRMTADRSVFVFERASARLIDRTCDTFDPAAHRNALQGMRMIACDGRNVWARQDRMWSTAALGVDRDGRVHFVHSRSPFAVHDFIEVLRAAPFSLARAMYLEGGPEATLYVNAGGVTLERYGSYETGFNENDDNDRAWPLPNVLGVRRRAA